MEVIVKSAWLINSKLITNFNASTGELQAQILFWIFAAGKTASSAEILVQRLCPDKNTNPFDQQWRFYTKSNLIDLLKENRCGCYNTKGTAIYELMNKVNYEAFDLKECTLDQLLEIKGIGLKTAKAFIVHTRRDAEHAIIDTHILKYLHLHGVKDVPKSTPTSKKEYARLEKEFLELCKESGKSVAEFDLEIWNSYANA